MKSRIELINNDWDTVLQNEFQKESFKKLMQNVNNERSHHVIFPSTKNIFRAFKISSFSKTKIVIIGQDPYHSKGKADGLAFSVPKGQKIPPSLHNIMRELKSDLKIPITKHGSLESWANQGVLLLNTILTVRATEAGSHKHLGWQKFTDSVIAKLSAEKKGLIFLLWGTFAQKKSNLINKKKHHILKTTHPSPLSAYKGFIGCKHFSKTNNILVKNNKTPINWKLCSNTFTLF